MIHEKTALQTIHCLGGILVDILLRPIRAYPRPKEQTSVFVDSLSLSPGGGATNSAITLAQMDCNVRLFSKIGNDYHGAYLVQKLQQAGVDVSALARTQERHTSTVVVGVHENGDRSFISYHGALGTFSLEDVDRECLLASAFLLYPDLFNLPGIDGEAGCELLRDAQNRGVATVVDATWGVSGLQKEIMEAVFPYVDYFLPSADECRLMYPQRSDEEIEAVHLPILRYIHGMASGVNNTFVVLFAAPPGAGKSTVVAFWEYLCQQVPNLTPIQPLSLDGFHYPNSYLQEHSIERHGSIMPLMSIKGAPETYDVRALCAAVEQLKQHGTVTWPVYDRNIHDPVPDAVTVSAPVVVIEGNWVLLDVPDWKKLRNMADFSIFLEADESLVRERLINRKVRGGYTLAEAEAHYERSDKANIERVMSHHLPSDVTLKWSGDARITMSGVIAQHGAKEEKHE